MRKLWVGAGGLETEGEEYLSKLFDLPFEQRPTVKGKNLLLCIIFFA